MTSLKNEFDKLLCTILTRSDLPKNIHKFCEYYADNTFKFSNSALWYDLNKNDLLLAIAIDLGDIEICKYLINDRSNKEYALTLACGYDKLDIAKWLVSIGANIHHEGDYPLHVACAAGHTEIVQWLLSLEAEHIDYGILTCCKRNQLEILHLLLQRNNNDIGHYKKECFEVACKKNHIAIAALLCDTDPSLRSQLNYTTN